MLQGAAYLSKNACRMSVAKECTNGRSLATYVLKGTLLDYHYLRVYPGPSSWSRPQYFMCVDVKLTLGPRPKSPLLAR